MSLSLLEMAFRRPKRPLICINLTLYLKAVVALRHTEFPRLLAVSAAQRLARVLVLLQGTVTISPRVR
jgi:hypothetical protein